MGSIVQNAMSLRDLKRHPSLNIQKRDGLSREPIVKSPVYHVITGINGVLRLMNVSVVMKMYIMGSLVIRRVVSVIRKQVLKNSFLIIMYIVNSL